MIPKIPKHLLPFVATQDASQYTAIDQAAWRFIMRVSKLFFSRHGHPTYLDGLRKTGISMERIPLISEIDACLKKMGWRAVPVGGFIPPSVFMEFQARGILPIACDMRTLEHLAYTPAPDIVHEAAGHAPMLADRAYARYLRHYGEISRKAIFSSGDLAIYEAIRHLSELKEKHLFKEEELEASQEQLDQAIAASQYTSEATHLARMNWWSVEYGLIGDLSRPKIYGAGLLSSVGESQHCLDPVVKKIPFTLDCIHASYDITRPQPQLFVTPDFETLTEYLEQYASTMAFRRGGLEGLSKAQMSQTVTTVVLDTGLQCSGIVDQFQLDSRRRISFLRLKGPSQLAFQDRQLKRQGPDFHSEGFSSPLGRLEGSPQSLAGMTSTEFRSMGFRGDAKGVILFQSGIKLTGVLANIERRAGSNLILQFKACTVMRGDEVLFQPSWGRFDLACGKKIVSVFGGAADRVRYLEATGGFNQRPRAPSSNQSAGNRPLNDLYAEVRKFRDLKLTGPNSRSRLSEIYQQLTREFPLDWLLPLEILELEPELAQIAGHHLKNLALGNTALSELITQGLKLLQETDIGPHLPEGSMPLVSTH